MITLARTVLLDAIKVAAGLTGNVPPVLANVVLAYEKAWADALLIRATDTALSAELWVAASGEDMGQYWRALVNGKRLRDFLASDPAEAVTLSVTGRHLVVSGDVTIKLALDPGEYPSLPAPPPPNEITLAYEGPTQARLYWTPLPQDAFLGALRRSLAFGEKREGGSLPSALFRATEGLLAAYGTNGFSRLVRMASLCEVPEGFRLEVSQETARLLQSMPKGESFEVCRTGSHDFYRGEGWLVSAVRDERSGSIDVERAISGQAEKAKASSGEHTLFEDEVVQLARAVGSMLGLSGQLVLAADGDRFTVERKSDLEEAEWAGAFRCKVGGWKTIRPQDLALALDLLASVGGDVQVSCDGAVLCFEGGEEATICLGGVK